jgi:hypothetical protein
MPMTIRDLWLLRYNEHPPDLAGAVYTSDQIEAEITRANLERRDGQADWTAIDLEEAMWMQPLRAGSVRPAVGRRGRRLVRGVPEPSPIRTAAGGTDGALVHIHSPS